MAETLAEQSPKWSPLINDCRHSLLCVQFSPKLRIIVQFSAVLHSLLSKLVLPSIHPLMRQKGESRSFGSSGAKAAVVSETMRRTKEREDGL